MQAEEVLQRLDVTKEEVAPASDEVPATSAKTSNGQVF